MSCCDYNDCRQGRDCPVRETPHVEGPPRPALAAPTAAKPLIWPVPDKLPAPKYCDRSKQNCGTPYTCNPLCRLIDSHLPIEMFEPSRWYQRPSVIYAFAGVGAVIGFALAVYQTF